MVFQAPTPPLVLASASPRRQELLRSLGLRFEVQPAEVDEAVPPGEAPEDGVRRLAREKARAVQARRPDALVLGADTLVILDGPGGPQALGKPADAAAARQMLRGLSGREHRVLTGLALCSPDGRCAEELGATTVRFAPIDGRWIDWYVGTGEPLDKAGAYGIQGAGAVFIPWLQGSWSNVVGLPLERLPALFAGLGYDLREMLARGA